jgi:ethanolamine permease
MVRPFRAPCYPLFPAIALAGALVCMATMIYYNWLIFCVFVAFLLLGYGCFLATAPARNRKGSDGLLASGGQ